jgi:hypothetical protein
MACLCATQELVWPSDADEGFVLDIARVKHKAVFEGQHGGYTMRVTITCVNDADGHRTEVGGNCVELQQLLQDTKAGATAADVESELGPAVNAMVAFLDVLANGC